MVDLSFFTSPFQRAKSRTDSDLENKLGGEGVQASYQSFFGNLPTIIGDGIVQMDEKLSRPIPAPNSHLLIHKIGSNNLDKIFFSVYLIIWSRLQSDQTRSAEKIVSIPLGASIVCFSLGMASSRPDANM
jgi:hypothetical protein